MYCGRRDYISCTTRFFWMSKISISPASVPTQSLFWLSAHAELTLFENGYFTSRRSGDFYCWPISDVERIWMFLLCLNR